MADRLAASVPYFMTVTVGRTLALVGFRPRLFFGEVGSAIGLGGLETSLPLLVTLICFFGVVSFVSFGAASDATATGSGPATGNGVLGVVDVFECSMRSHPGSSEISVMATSVCKRAFGVGSRPAGPAACTCSCWCQSKEMGSGWTGSTCAEGGGLSESSGDAVFCLFLRS